VDATISASLEFDDDQLARAVQSEHVEALARSPESDDHLAYCDDLHLVTKHFRVVDDPAFKVGSRIPNSARRRDAIGAHPASRLATVKHQHVRLHAVSLALWADNTVGAALAQLPHATRSARVTGATPITQDSCEGVMCARRELGRRCVLR
jgi:hypothetical protein